MMPYTIKTTENSHNKHKKQDGNAMIYVLIALAMFGFLTMTLSRSNDQADGQDIDDEQAELYALDLIEYAASAQQVVDMMLYSGSEIDDLDFVTPDDAAFNTPPHHHKIYHPQGGGLNYIGDDYHEKFFQNGTRGWQHMTLTNVDWTPTPNNDVIFTFMDINPTLCAILNKKVINSKNIPALTAGSSANSLFRETSSTPAENFTTAACPSCDGISNFCISNPGATQFHFYNIIVAQ